MKEEILKVKEEIQNYIKESKTLQRLEEIRVNYMGKKGIFTELSKKMKDLSAEERPKIGQIINEVKEKINSLLDERNRALKEKELNENKEFFKDGFGINNEHLNWNGYQHIQKFV